jgi:hypothetical protein
MATKRKIYSDLQNTLETNDHIKEVHFTKKGDWFFNVFKVGNDLFGRVDHVITRNEGSYMGIRKEVGVKETLIVETLTRDEVLAATPIPSHVDTEIK